MKQIDVKILATNLYDQSVSKELRVKTAFEILSKVGYCKKIELLQEKEGEIR